MKPIARITTQEFCNQSQQSKTTLWRKSKIDPSFPKAEFIFNKKLYRQDAVTAWIEAQVQSEQTHNNLLPKYVA